MFLLQGHLEGAPRGKGALWAWRMSAALLVVNGFMALICTGGPAAFLPNCVGRLQQQKQGQTKTSKDHYKLCPAYLGSCWVQSVRAHVEYINDHAATSHSHFLDLQEYPCPITTR
jgi:hypothetical protein